ncbi:MAG: ABC transporter permease subunit [Tabrizicola sp.]|nr:ABC transporter permease subunit [Tabrizicola sp.]
MRARTWQSIAALALAGWMILPLLPLLIWSIAHGWRFPDLMPQTYDLKAWSTALSPATGVLRSFGLTVLIGLLTTILALLIGLPAGRALGLYRFRGKSLVLLCLAAPAILPGIALVFGLHGIFLRLGIAGTAAGVILAHLVPVLPYVTLVLAAVFSRFDPAFEDQARSLGASPLQCLIRVTLPLIWPGVLTAALFAFLVSWSQYLLTLAIGGGRVQTLPLLLFSSASAGRNDVTAAIAILYVLPGLLILLVTARQITGQSTALTGGASP